MNLSINYFLNQLPGVALDNFKVYFDFVSGNNSTWNFQQTLPGDAINADAGRSVACSSDGGVIAYAGALNGQGGSGAAWIYTGNKTNGWAFKQKIVGTQSNGRLSRVGMSENGNVIVLGGFGYYDYSGAAVVYTGNAQNGWSFKEELRGDGGEREWFGRTVKVNNSGTVIAVGAQYDGGGEYSASGAGFIFTGNAVSGWKLAQKLTSPVPSFPSVGYSNFNRLSMNKDGSVIIMGGFPSWGPSFTPIFTGNPSVGRWERKQILSGNLEGYSDTIFIALDVEPFYSGTYTRRGILNSKPYYNLVGTPDSTTLSSISWSATRNQWEFSNSLGVVRYSGSQNTTFPWQVANASWSGIPPTLYFNVFDGFGISTDINDDGDTIVVGAPWDSEAGETVGALYIYTGNSVNGWALKEKKLGDSISGMHGWNVAVSRNSNVIVGGSPHDGYPYVNVNTGPRSKSYSIVYQGDKNLGWNAKQKIAETNNTGAFGTYIDLSSSGDLIVVGGPYDNTAGINRAGAVMIYNSGNNPLLITNKSGDLNISGEIKNISLPINLNNFYKNTGEAFLNSGSYIKIHNLTGVDSKNFTISFIYENLRKGGSTLISNIQTGAFNSFNEFGIPQVNIINKGFEFGITSNNKLYFEYYSLNGPDIFVSDFSLSNKNSVFLSVTENNIIMGYYDFYKNTLLSNNFIIDSKFIFDPKDLYIGYNPDSSGLFNFNQLFTGSISEFLLFSPSIYNYDLVSINSGYAHIYVPGSLVPVTTIISGITGYINQITGTISGLTGILSTPTGVITDEWGVSYTGFQDIELSGTIPLSGMVALSGAIDFFTEIVLTGESISLDYTFLNSLGKNNINFLSKIDSGDFLDINGYTDYSGLKNVQKNIPLGKDFVENKFYVPNDVNFSGNPLVFINGQALLSGNLLSTGSPYNPGILLSNDYYYDENLREFIFNDIYNENDSAFMDIETGNVLISKTFSVPTGVGTIGLSNWNVPFRKLYFNGQKLISGVHYGVNISQVSITFNRSFNPLFSGITGVLIGVPISYNFSSIFSGSGCRNLITTNVRYLYNLTEIYKNGIRQTLNTDYLELPLIDSNNGTGFFDVKPDLIYNNEEFIFS